MDWILTFFSAFTTWSELDRIPQAGHATSASAFIRLSVAVCTNLMSINYIFQNPKRMFLT